MTLKFPKAGLLGAAVAITALVPVLGTTEASARGRQYFSQDYQFKTATSGYDGPTYGGYYCSYQKLPNRVCDAYGNNCKVVGWTLRQFCQ